MLAVIVRDGNGACCVACCSSRDSKGLMAGIRHVEGDESCPRIVVGEVEICCSMMQGR